MPPDINTIPRKTHNPELPDTDQTNRQRRTAGGVVTTYLQRHLVRRRVVSATKPEQAHPQSVGGKRNYNTSHPTKTVSNSKEEEKPIPQQHKNDCYQKKHKSGTPCAC